MWFMLSTAVSNCGVQWPSLNFSAAVLPLQDWLEPIWRRDNRVKCIYVSGLLMSSQVFPPFRELVLACFSSGKCSSPTRTMTGWERALQGSSWNGKDMLLQESSKSHVLRSVSNLCVLKKMLFWEKIPSGEEKTNIPCQYHTTGSKFCLVIYNTYTYFFN